MNGRYGANPPILQAASRVCNARLIALLIEAGATTRCGSVGANNWLVYIVLYAVTGVSFGHLYCSRHWRTGFLVGLPLFFWSLLTPGRVTISAITLAVSTLSVRVGGLLDIETKHVLSRDRSQLKVPTGDTIRYRARKGDQLTSVIANITKDGKPIEEAYLLSRSHRVTCYVIELQDGELIAPHLVVFN